MRKINKVTKLDKILKIMRITLFAILFITNLTSFGQDNNQYKNFTSSSKTLILKYQDFGPQVMAYELIGFKWWQWNNHGDSDSKTKYDIRVVVFKDISLETVKNKYPVDKNHKIDFRYLPYDKSIKYLDSIMSEYNQDFSIDKYSNLKEKIVSHFNPKQ